MGMMMNCLCQQTTRRGLYSRRFRIEGGVMTGAFYSIVAALNVIDGLSNKNITAKFNGGFATIMWEEPVNGMVVHQPFGGMIFPDQLQ